MTNVKPIPDGFSTVTPYLIVHDGNAAIQFYERAFGAKEVLRLDGPNNTLAHGEIVIGESRLMLANEHPGMGALSPKSIGGSPVSMLIYVPNVDEAFQQALDAGATEIRPVQDQFYGDRAGTLKDPFGHQWTLATHTEDVSQEEVERRFAEMMKQAGGSEASG
ncbi:MAG: VOC family protein [Planctomycetaceae bacterium]|nr:VOC family protein [Planctomycetaceae bacterium]MCB9953263.1 VOC family protein [Planctomycetaceae bacterium]